MIVSVDTFFFLEAKDGSRIHNEDVVMKQKRCMDVNFGPIGFLGEKCSCKVRLFSFFPSQCSCHLPLNCLFDASPRIDNEDVVTRVLHLITFKNRHLLCCSLHIRLRA